MKHTPEPWIIGEMIMTPENWMGLNDGKNPLTIIQKGHEVIAACWGTDENNEEDKPQAERIVSCVNALAGLEPEAMKELVKVLTAVTKLDWPKSNLSAFAKEGYQLRIAFEKLTQNQES